MNRDPRNQTLLAQLSETNPFKAELAHRLFKIGNDFERDVAAIGADGRRSARAKQEDAQARAEQARRELDAAQKPVIDYRKQSEQLSSGKKKPTFDRTDSVAAQNRREYREKSERLSFGQLAMRLVGPKRSTALIDALIFEFEDDAWLYLDLDDPKVFEMYKTAHTERIRDLNPELMPALEARASNDTEITMIFNVVRGDIESDATQLASRAA
jgi:hypothetical protein